MSVTGSSTAPTNTGTYTVVATFASSNTNYTNATSSPVTFTIAKATLTVVATDAGGIFKGSAFPATAQVTGIGGAAVTGSTAFTYYVGNAVNGAGSSTAPTTPGTYTVVAAFTSSNANYANATQLACSRSRLPKPRQPSWQLMRVASSREAPFLRPLKSPASAARR